MKYFKSNNGAIAIVLLWCVIFFIVILLSVFTLEVYYTNVKAEIVKDGLTMSALSVYQGIDIEQIKSGNIEMNQNITNTFEKYLAKNLHLNSDLTSRTNSVIAGQVSIDKFIIYNKDSIDKVYPNGQSIYYKPSLYVKISYDIEPILKGILGGSKRVSTTATADLISN